MGNQRQLIILLIIVASFTSFLAGYMLTKPHQDGVLSQQRAALIDRFNGITPSAAPVAITTDDGLVQLTSDETLSAVPDISNDVVLYYHRDTGFVSAIS